MSPVLTVGLQDDEGEDVVADAPGEEEGPRTPGADMATMYPLGMRFLHTVID